MGAEDPGDRTARRLRRAIAFPVLLALGLLQMLASLLGLPEIAGLAAATNASPHPKVFSAVDELETFSTKFYLEWEDAEGRFRSLRLGPEEYSRVRGPYNRRNVYGAALAYGPILASHEKSRRMFETVLQRALTDEAPLLRELGIDPSSIRYPVTVRLVPENASALGGRLPVRFEVDQL